MSCTNHPADASSSVGVCASCLRERLFAVTAAQTPDDPWKSRAQQQLPNPLSFPRSVSPYISRRKSDTNAATWQIHGSRNQRFHTTPTVEMGREDEQRSGSSKGRGRYLSSLFLGIFRSKSVSDPPGIATASCAASPSWFSAIIPRRRRKQNREFSMEESSIGAMRKARRDRNRGMSPASYPGEVDDDGFFRGGLSGYSSEPSQRWKQTPRMTPATTRRGGGRGAGLSRNVSGLAFCLSPLVRPSPNRHWSQKGAPPETVASWESRVPTKAHLSPAATFCKNRSRKLVDLGRYIHTTNH